MPIILDLKTAILAAMDTASEATENPAAAREAWAEAVANAIGGAIEASIQGTTVDTAGVTAGGNALTGTITLEPNIT